MTAGVKKGGFSSGFSSKSDFATLYVSQNIPKKHLGHYSVFHETSAAALLQSLKPYFRLHICRSSDLARASSFESSALVLDGMFQLFLTDPPCSVSGLRKFKKFSQNSLSFEAMKNTVDLTANLLWPGGHTILFYTSRHFFVWHTVFCEHSSMQKDGSSPAYATTSRDMFMVSAALLSIVIDLSRHGEIPARKSCAFATAV